jgi:hypothetical protein
MPRHGPPGNPHNIGGASPDVRQDDVPGRATKRQNVARRAVHGATVRPGQRGRRRAAIASGASQLGTTTTTSRTTTPNSSSTKTTVKRASGGFRVQGKGASGYTR